MTPACLASHLVVLFLALWRSCAVPCTLLQLGIPAIVEDMNGAYQLAEALNCSGGSFHVQWVGLVTIDQPIRVLDGTTLRIKGASDGSSIVDAGNETSHFEVFGGTLELSNLTLVNGATNSRGGSIMGTDAYVAVTTCNLVGNKGYFGGGIYLLNSTLETVQTDFVRNSAMLGGAIYAETSIIKVGQDGQFTDNNATSGGALYSWACSLHVASSTFMGNNATVGVGVILGFSSMKADNTTFVSNNATGFGGAIWADHSTVTLTNGSSVVDNSGGNGGGGLYVVGHSSLFLKDAMVFEGNVAEHGGATFLDTATAFLEGCVIFANNVADVSGGAVYAQTSTISFTGTTIMKYNRATFGGGIRLYNVCQVAVSGDISFFFNTADQGGGLWLSQQSNFIVLGSCSFESNHARNGGAGIVSYGSSSALFSTSSTSNFYNNTAVRNGGAIYLSTHSELIIHGSSYFSENRAKLGGGILAGEGTYVTLNGSVTMTGNVALSSGGAIYVNAPGKLQIEGLRFYRNKATQNGGAITMFAAGTEGSVATVSQCEFLNNEADDAGGALLIGGGVVSISSSTFQHNKAGRAGGAILVSGVVNVEDSLLVDNEARAGPGIYNVVSVTFDSTDLCDNTLICDEGSFLDWNVASAYNVACESCPVRANNCTTAYYERVRLCEPVLEHTTSPASDGTLESLYVESGYWRSSNSSRDIRECYEPEACHGGTQGLCASGYEGPFCAVCALGYARGLGYKCTECTDFRRNTTFSVIISVVVAVMFVAVVVGKQLLGCSAAEPTTTTTAPSTSRPRGNRSFFLFKFARVSRALKIVIVALQIVTQFASVTSTTYPKVYAVFLGWVDAINLNIAWILSAGCMIDSSFYRSLLISTIGYLGFVGIVFISYAVNRRRCPAGNQDARAKLDHGHASVLFWTSLLIYATVSSTVFQTFSCDSLDNGVSFLRADHSLECYTTTHKAYMAYASVMAAVYPFGIPACYAFVLYRSRTCLAAGQVVNTAEAAIYRELWEPYRPQVYYYEVIECLRRVVLSGAVVFIFPNSAGQVAVSVLLAMLSAAVFMILDPYASHWHTWLARTSHAVIILSLYLALLQKVDSISDEDSSKHVFACVLIVLNCALILSVGVEAFGMCSVTVREWLLPTPRVTSYNVDTSRARMFSSASCSQVGPSVESPLASKTSV